MRYKLRIIIITGLKNTFFLLKKEKEKEMNIKQYFVIGTVLLLLSSNESGGYWLMTIIDQYDAGWCNIMMFAGFVVCAFLATRLFSLALRFLCPEGQVCSVHTTRWWWWWWWWWWWMVMMIIFYLQTSHSKPRKAAIHWAKYSFINTLD